VRYGSYSIGRNRAKTQKRSGESLMMRYCDQLGSIVDRRRAETALHAAKVSADAAKTSAVNAMVAAQTASRMKSEFLANMSHELRTPLNAIIGFSEVMNGELLGPIGTRRYLEYANDINESAQHLLHIINDILDLSQIEAGQMRLHEEWVTMDSVVNSCVAIVRERAQRAEVTINTELLGSTHRVLVDERKLKQILINILSNAVKFSRPGGSIALRTSLLPTGRYQIKISDTGIGMDQEDVDHVFEPFVQLDSALHRKYEGTGLGLSLTRRLIEMHGGSIALESKMYVGTTATIELPIERVAVFNEASDTDLGDGRAQGV
jgi:signal transduction histidine kinase